MEALALLNPNEMSKIDSVKSALRDDGVNLTVFGFQQPLDSDCVNQEKITELVNASEVVVYFASKENEKNSCLDIALKEAARTNTKVICINDDEGVAGPGSLFEQFGDCLVNDVSSLSSIILESTVSVDWQNPDGSLREDRPFKRYKCGK